MTVEEWKRKNPPIKRKPLTNADHIRAMTNDELAHLLHDAEEHIFTGNLWDWSQWREWLAKEVDE